jgi:hypothetical protein
MNAFDTHKQEAIRRRIADMQEDEPGLTFTAAWKRLRQKRPELFDYARPTADASYEPSPDQTKAGKIWRDQRVIHAELGVLQQEENLTFQDAWNRLKRKRPELFSLLDRAASANVKLVKCDDHDQGRRRRSLRARSRRGTLCGLKREKRPSRIKPGLSHDSRITKDPDTIESSAAPSCVASTKKRVVPPFMSFLV